MWKIVYRSGNNIFNNTDNRNSQPIHIDMLDSNFKKGNLGQCGCLQI
jgi:hypothetical protein